MPSLVSKFVTSLAATLDVFTSKCILVFASYFLKLAGSLRKTPAVACTNFYLNT